MVLIYLKTLILIIKAPTLEPLSPEPSSSSVLFLDLNRVRVVEGGRGLDQDRV